MNLIQPVDRNLSKIPPFHDAHIHFMVDGRPAGMNDHPSLRTSYLSKGILSIQDMGHHTGLGLEFKKIKGKPKEPFLKIQTAGFALYKKGTYGQFLGKGVSGRKEIAAAIRNLAETGADFIKIINSGIVAFLGKNPVSGGGFSSEEWKVIQEEAGRYRLKIFCHANGDPAIGQAIHGGAASIEHGFFISRETLHEMGEKRVSWTPTVNALLSIKSFLTGEEQRQLDQVIEDHLKAVYSAASVGVQLRVGTDSGSKGVQPGESFFKELRLFRKSGLSLGQILSAACLNPEEIEPENYLLVNKNFIDQGRVEEVVY